MDPGLHQHLEPLIKQSPPVDLTKPYAADWVRGKTILITGGASGFGAGFVRQWAKHGAAIVVGDINTEKGDALVRDIRKETGNKDIYFVHCDVTDWQSQVNLFKEAVKLSPSGGIDTVVANAGIAGNDILQLPKGLNAANPPKPNFKIMDVNCTGVMYTTHLALYWLPKNPNSSPCSLDADPVKSSRDRHLLLLGSIASLTPIPAQPQYGAAKHAVLGLFRPLRGTSYLHGVRVNLICPYFIDTPIVTPVARIALAGGGMGKVEDVVDAGTRLVADSRILGRALAVGPRVNLKEVDGEWKYVEKSVPGGRETAIWECYADDWTEVDAFTHGVIRIINSVQAVRGWIGWAQDVIKAVGYGFGLIKR